METLTERRDWDWDRDGVLDGMYVETRSVTIKNGPSAGQTKTVVDFHVGPDDELVTVWPPTVLSRRFREELERRGKPDFEPGERMVVRPKGKETGPNGPYWDFDDVEFEHAAPKPTAAELFGIAEEQTGTTETRPRFDSDDVDSPLRVRRMSYERLQEQEERPKTVRNLNPTWESLQPLGSLEGELRERVVRFCEAKRITPGALLALSPRIRVGKGGSVELAFAGTNGNGVVTAIKFRPLDGPSGETRAEPGSTWLRPIVVGKLDSSDWLIAEGETDGARLLDLAPPGAAVMVVPAGAKAFKKAWADLVPRGAIAYLCFDADEAGDAGAAKAARVLGGTTVRVRPPVDGGDWCDWPGSREEFIEIVRAAREVEEQPFALPLEEFIAETSETPPALVGDEREAPYRPPPPHPLRTRRGSTTAPRAPRRERRPRESRSGRSSS